MLHKHLPPHPASSSSMLLNSWSHLSGNFPKLTNLNLQHLSLFWSPDSFIHPLTWHLRLDISPSVPNLTRPQIKDWATLPRTNSPKAFSHLHLRNGTSNGLSHPTQKPRRHLPSSELSHHQVLLTVSYIFLESLPFPKTSPSHPTFGHYHLLPGWWNRPTLTEHLEISL